MTPGQVTIKGHKEIVKRLSGLEARNQNEKLYMRATLQTQESKGGSPIEILNNNRKSLGNMYLLQGYYLLQGCTQKDNSRHLANDK
jgi:hypothetical protein